MTSKGPHAVNTNVKRPIVPQVLAMCDQRMRYMLRNTTPSTLKTVAAIMTVSSVLGLVIPLSAVVGALFGAVGSMELLRPAWYPFSFSKRFLYGMRLWTLLYCALGIAGVVVNWSDIYPYVKPVIDWINE